MNETNETNETNELNELTNSPNGKKQNTLLDVLMGIGLSIVAYSLIWVVTILGIPAIIKVLFDFVVLVLFGFLTVKFFRKGHKPAAIAMLILISPGVLGLLVFGACAVLFIPY